MAETTSDTATTTLPLPPQGDPPHDDLAALCAGVAIDALDDEDVDEDDRITLRMPSLRGDQPEP